MRETLPLLALALAAAGCPQSSSLSCPSNTHSAGFFNLALDLQHTPDECLSRADGGNASIVPDHQPVNNSLFCAGITDAGPTLFLLVPNSFLLRASPVDAGGGFVFVSPTLLNADTLCSCEADVNETITGNLVGAGDGGFAVIADAGLVPLPTQVDGSVVQTLAPADGGCLCNVPCADHLVLTGTPSK
ncbi:MAG TPA: hypothetical protein VG496_15965 [Myxococcales bacterium]|nr:hypothetical protein [Myxococcales bacterium]